MAEQLAPRTTPPLRPGPMVQLLPASARFSLRGGAEVMRSAGTALGFEFAQQACRSATSAADITRKLAEVLSGQRHSLVDISHRQLALQIEGAEASALLNVGCPLDLDLSAFPVGMCTRTILGKADVVLWRTGARQFHLEVWRSFADYVVAFLSEAAREFAW
jgi:sarcosine oxidase, subunit gamma